MYLFANFDYFPPSDFVLRVWVGIPRFFQLFSEPKILLFFFSEIFSSKNTI